MIIWKVHINIRKLNGLVTVSVRAKFFVLDLQQKQRGLALKLETLTAPPSWNNDNEAIMLELLRIKFAPGTALAQKLMSTARKSLAEAGFSEKFAIGVPLHHKDLFDTTKWKKNLLGQALMKIRQELIK